MSDQSPEITHVEWQAAEGSWTLHAIDTTRPAWHNPDGSRRQSGPRSLCGRYPQRNAERPWWALPVAEAPERPGFNLIFCADCAEVVTPPGVATVSGEGSTSEQRPVVP